MFHGNPSCCSSAGYRNCTEALAAEARSNSKGIFIALSNSGILCFRYSSKYQIQYKLYMVIG